MAIHAKTNNEIIQLQVFVGLAIIGLNFFLTNGLKLFVTMH